MQALLDFVGRNFRHGTLEFVAPGGRIWTLGHGEPRARLRVRDAGVVRRILFNPRFGFPETFMDHGWEPEDGDLMAALEVGVRNISVADYDPFSRNLRRLRNLFAEINTPRLARRNVSRHYDLDFDLYRRFLDADLHYSCAYFREPGMDLEAAQQAKCELIAAKLDLKPGARVLDIGSGWGSLAMYLARRFDAQVLGITLSQEQVKVSQARAKEHGLAGKVEFRLEDYRRTAGRKTAGRFDAVVSVGMFEHVGRPQYRVFFERVRDLLEPSGVALLHTIGRRSPPAGTNPWIRKYIFPGSYIPSASEVLSAVEPTGLFVTDLEIWRLHYARTLACWNERFQKAREEIKSRMGERFCRMWEFYLQASEANFRWDDLVVFQLQMTRDLERLPLTRNYLYRNVRVVAPELRREARVLQQVAAQGERR